MLPVKVQNQGVNLCHCQVYQDSCTISLIPGTTQGCIALPMCLKAKRKVFRSTMIHSFVLIAVKKNCHSMCPKISSIRVTCSVEPPEGTTISLQEVSYKFVLLFLWDQRHFQKAMCLLVMLLWHIGELCFSNCPKPVETGLQNCSLNYPRNCPFRALLSILCYWNFINF